MMNKYLVIYKVTYIDFVNGNSEEILNDIIESEKLNEDLFNKIYNRYYDEIVCILNVIKLDD